MYRSLCGFLVGLGVGCGVAAGVGVTTGAVVGGGDDDGGALGEGDGLGDGDGDGDGEAIADGDATADGLGAAELASTRAGSVAGSTLGSSVGSMVGDGTRAIAVEPGAAAMTGRSMPPRCTTKPNEIPADSTRIRIAAHGRLRHGTRPAGGLRVLERRGALEVPRAVRVRGAQADELLLARGLRARIPDRRTAVAVVGLEERRDEVAIELEPEERTDRGIGRACGIVEDRQRRPRGWRRGCDLGRPGLGRGGPGLGRQPRRRHRRASSASRSGSTLPVSLSRVPPDRGSLVPPAHCRGGIHGGRLRLPFRANINQIATIVAPTHRHWRQRPEAMALPLPAPTSTQSPESDPSRLAPHRIKRCTYRRLISLDRARERIYEVECLYPDRKVPIPLGDLDSAMPICNACAAAHIFRPDED